MRSTKEKTVRLGPQAIRELLNPARIEVYESLQVTGPSSVGDLAKRLGRPADSLYYHLKKLQAISVIEESSEVQQASGPGRKAAVYRIVPERLHAQLDPKSRVSREAWAQGASSVLRLAQRNFGQALESAPVKPEGTGRNLVLWRTKARLSPAKLKEVNRHIDALQELLLAQTGNTTGELHAITCVMTPLEEKGKA